MTPTSRERTRAVSSPKSTSVIAIYRMPVADWVERICTVFHVKTVARAGPAIPMPQRIARKNQRLEAEGLAATCPLRQIHQPRAASPARAPSDQAIARTNRLSGSIDIAG